MLRYCESGVRLNHALPRHGGQVAVLLVNVGRLAQHAGHLFPFLQLQQVHDVAALGRAAALRHLVALEPVYPAAVSHKQHRIMGRADKEFFGEVVVFLVHALHAAAAAVLRRVGIAAVRLMYPVWDSV